MEEEEKKVDRVACSLAAAHASSDDIAHSVVAGVDEPSS